MKCIFLHITVKIIVLQGVVLGVVVPEFILCHVSRQYVRDADSYSIFRSSN